MRFDHIFLTRILIVSAVATALALSYGCDTKGGKPVNEPTFSYPARGDAVAAQEVVRLNIAALDNSFDPAEFTVNGGVIIVLNMTNKGTAIHNLRLAGADNVYANIDDALSDPPLVNAGESAVVEWFTPVAGGVFDFRCDFHPQSMTGRITVTPGQESTNGGQEGP